MIRLIGCVFEYFTYECIPAAAVSHRASDFQFLRKTRQLPAKDDHKIISQNLASTQSADSILLSVLVH